MELVAVARKLLRLQRDLAQAKRPIDRKVAAARLDGACEIAYLFGLSGTPTEVLMTVLDAYRDAGLRPDFSAVGNTVQRKFDQQLAEDLAGRLVEIRRRVPGVGARPAGRW